MDHSLSAAVYIAAPQAYYPFLQMVHLANGSSPVTLIESILLRFRVDMSGKKNCWQCKHPKQKIVQLKWNQQQMVESFGTIEYANANH